MIAWFCTLIAAGAMAAGSASVPTTGAAPADPGLMPTPDFAGALPGLASGRLRFVPSRPSEVATPSPAEPKALSISPALDLRLPSAAWLRATAPVEATSTRPVAGLVDRFAEPALQPAPTSRLIQPIEPVSPLVLKARELTTIRLGPFVGRYDVGYVPANTWEKFEGHDQPAMLRPGPALKATLTIEPAPR